jgi:hypothetical protein
MKPCRIDCRRYQRPGSRNTCVLKFEPHENVVTIDFRIPRQGRAPWYRAANLALLPVTATGHRYPEPAAELRHADIRNAASRRQTINWFRPYRFE